MEHADENREGGTTAESGAGTEGRDAALRGGRAGAVWTGSAGDMSHGEPSPRGLVGAVYKWKKQEKSGFPRPPWTGLCLITA